MARITLSGADELELSLQEIAEIPEDVLDEMLSDGADAAMEGHRKSLQSHGLVRTGTLLRSLKKKKKKGRDGKLYYLISPSGTHHTNKDGSKVRNAEVGSINEFGAPRKHIPAKQWMRDGNEQSADKVVRAEFSVYDEYLKSKNL